MSRKKKELPLLENIEITGVAAEGNAIARVNDMVLFIPYGAPGDVADIKLTARNARMPKDISNDSRSHPNSARNHSASISARAAAADGSIFRMSISSKPNSSR